MRPQPPPRLVQNGPVFFDKRCAVRPEVYGQAGDYGSCRPFRFFNFFRWNFRLRCFRGFRFGSFCRNRFCFLRPPDQSEGLKGNAGFYDGQGDNSVRLKN